MNMWMVPTWLMCGQHRSGEHNEIHKHRVTFEKQHSIAGRVAGNAVEPLAMKARHDELAASLNHHSPFKQPDTSYLPQHERKYRVNRFNQLMELRRRCSACRERIDNEQNYI